MRARTAYRSRMKLGCLAVLLVALTACGGADDDVVEQGTSQQAPAGESGDDAPQGQLLESGFGQDGQYVQGVALVENTSDHGGQTVTVNFNFLDDAGDVIASVSQVDSFNHSDQTVAVQGFTDLGEGAPKVAAVEPTLLVEDEGTFEETAVDFGTSEGEVVQEFGSWRGTFPVANPTDEPLQSPAVRVACRDQDGVINGGGFTFPDLVPPNGEVIAEVSLTVTGKPAECTAYIGGPIF